MIHSEEDGEVLAAADHGSDEEDKGEFGDTSSSSEEVDSYDYRSDSLTEEEFDEDDLSESHVDDEDNYSADTSSSQNDEIHLLSSPESSERVPISAADESHRRRPSFFWEIPGQRSVKQQCCYNTHLGREGAVGLARFLIRDGSVTESLLIGGGIGIGNDGAAALAYAVALNASLSSFGLCGVDVEEEGMNYLREACGLLDDKGASSDDRIASFLRPLFDGSCLLQLTLMDAILCGKRAVASVEGDAAPAVLHMTLFSSVTHSRGMWMSSVNRRGQKRVLRAVFEMAMERVRCLLEDDERILPLVWERARTKASLAGVYELVKGKPDLCQRTREMV